jgi:type II restriction/modification system DNA methylase subunit YeeA
VHGRPNTDVVKQWRNGLDLMRRCADMWIVDFGVSMKENQAALYEEPFNHVRINLQVFRSSNRREAYRDAWWIFGEARPGLRIAIANLKRYIATAQTSKHRAFVWLESQIIPDQQLIVIARDDDTTFGILSSRLHVAWALAVGGRMGKGNDPRYNPTLCFQTFPFPGGLTPNLNPAHYTNPHAAAIATAAARLNQLRENWLNPPEWVEVVPEVIAGYPDRIIPKPEFAKAIKERTLTNLYNARAKGEVHWLEDAHRALDATVAAAYGWVDYSPAMADDEILRRLLALNLARV